MIFLSPSDLFPPSLVPSIEKKEEFAGREGAEDGKGERGSE